MHKWVFALAIALFAFGCTSEKPAGDPSSADATVAPSEDKGAAATGGDDFETKLRPMLVANCSPCHVGSDAKKGVNMETVAASDKDVLHEMHEEVSAGKMPPKDAKQLDDATRADMLAQLETASK